ncbi:MAG: hypothetical protein HYV40_00425 [Candidatus Levybacteria bacterium]|nr:hypothetical protein [Candidatus Levybacteria bacterium]
MNERIVGYILLFAGIIIMFGSLIQVLLVFTGKMEPFRVFSIASPTISLDSLLPQLPTETLTLPTTAKKPIELIPTAQFNKMINMSVMIFLMGFVLSFGYKLSSLGVMMVRPISVKLSAKQESSSQTSSQ